MERNDILTILSLPIHEHGTSLHLFSALISLIKVLSFSSYKSSIYSVKFIPIYLILRSADIKWYYVFNFKYH